MLFESLVNSEWFKRKAIILFLNKIDLFRAKLALSVKGQGRDNKRLPKYMKVKLKKRRRKRDRPGGRQAKYKGRPGRPGFYSNDSGLVLPASRQSTSRV